MTKPITLMSILRKFCEHVEYGRLSVSRKELKIIYMINPGEPFLNSNRALNEKINDLRDFEVLKVDSRNNDNIIYQINWTRLQNIMAQLRESQKEE